MCDKVKGHWLRSSCPLSNALHLHLGTGLDHPRRDICSKTGSKGQLCVILAGVKPGPQGWPPGAAPPPPESPFPFAFLSYTILEQAGSWDFSSYTFCLLVILTFPLSCSQVHLEHFLNCRSMSHPLLPEACVVPRCRKADPRLGTATAGRLCRFPQQMSGAFSITAFLGRRPVRLSPKCTIRANM
jgi:hypothetical protein